MGTKVKTFESTGLAPNGRLYAGDLNAIQDHYADQANYSQEIDAGTYGIGDATIKLMKYGTAESRLSSALRTDGIVRGLGGLYAGAFTTAQRDAIAVGSRPYGLVILNTTTNQYEWNKGTDPTPAWSAMSPAVTEVAIGSVSDWPWAAATIPSWSILPFGQAISRTTYAGLANLAAQSGYAYGNGDGSTTFGVPDFRGRHAIGKDDMGGAAAGRLTVAISGISGTSLGAVGGAEGITLSSGQMPAHNHSASDSGHAHGIYDPTHIHGVGDPGHNHQMYDFYVAFGGTGQGMSYPAPGGTLSEPSAFGGNRASGTGVYLGYSGTGIGIYNGNAAISVANAGGSAVHPNVPPVVVVNKIMRAI
jgi:microcystin-dependent protein